MTLEKITTQSNAGATGANHRSTEFWRGEINGKAFTILIDSCAAPAWSADADLDEDEQAAVLTAVETI